jgi:hypothetical protein
MKVRMPLFRLVQYHHGPKDGRGVMPDIYVPPTVEHVRKGRDGKMDKVIEIIKDSSAIQKMRGILTGKYTPHQPYRR